jgi:hypothetical protein
MALALNLVIAVFVVGSLGLAAFEMSRILLARDQLKHCLELSALAGGATMASTSLTGPAAQAEATAVATNILQMNAVLGKALSSSVVVVSSPTALAPSANQVAVSYEFDDPITGQPSATGNVLKVYGAYAYPLFAGGFGSIGVCVYTVMAEVSAGLPAMDLMIVYSNDSGMDDQTPVTFIRRYWDPVIPAIAYFTPPGSSPPESGSIWSIVCPNLLGSAVNALPPQNLDAAGDPLTSLCKKLFSETGPAGKTRPLRGLTNTNSPPGDAPPGVGGIGLPLNPGSGNTQDTFAYKTPSLGPIVAHKKPHSWLRQLASNLSKVHLEQPAYAWFTSGADFGTASYNPWQSDPTMFTDVVVNLDGNNVFGGYTDSGQFSAFPFPDVSYLTEASRGNMENSGIGPNVHVDNAIANASQPGYLQAYECLAYKQLQPKMTIHTALQGFMTKLLQTSNCHYGFVSFNDRAGLSIGDTMSAPTVSWAYPVAKNTTYALPQVPLDPNNNNMNAINNILAPPTTITQPLFVPNGGSNLADGLQQAYNNLTGPNARTGSFKAIVVVTDKVPDRDLAGNIYRSPNTNGQALTDAVNVASQCRTQGIPIFIIALDQTGGGMTPYFQSQFNDQQGSGGLVATAGNGGVLYTIPWAQGNQGSTLNTLNGNFNNIVRQLMSLVVTGGPGTAGAASGGGTSTGSSG